MYSKNTESKQNQKMRQMQYVYKFQLGRYIKLNTYKIFKVGWKVVYLHTLPFQIIFHEKQNKDRERMHLMPDSFRQQLTFASGAGERYTNENKSSSSCTHLHFNRNSVAHLLQLLTDLVFFTLSITFIFKLGQITNTNYAKPVNKHY